MLAIRYPIAAQSLSLERLVRSNEYPHRQGVYLFYPKNPRAKIGVITKLTMIYVIITYPIFSLSSSLLFPRFRVPQKQAHFYA